MMDVLIEEFKPAEMLSPFVAWYRECVFNANELNVLEQRIIPHGYIDLIVHLNDNYCQILSNGEWQKVPEFNLVGLYTHSCQVRFRYRVNAFWIRFKPECFYQLFNISVATFEKNHFTCAESLGKCFYAFCTTLTQLRSAGDRVSECDTYLTRRLARSPMVERSYIQLVAEMIRSEHSSLSIDQLCEIGCIGPRQLAREFQRKIGVSPKFYMRMNRINHVQHLLNEGAEFGLSSIAYHCGYTDQSHFIRDYKQLTGEVPTLFLTEKEKYIIT